MSKHSGFVKVGQHTEGVRELVVTNWGYQIVSGSRVIAAISGHTEDPRKDAQAYADALELLAAPDLLAACEALITRYGWGHNANDKEMQQARDAIARARSL